MTKRKNKIKVKVSNNTTNTLIKVAGLGIVSYLAFKMLSNNENGLAYLGGSSSGYTGSGTDFSAIPAGFFTETPPVFNITNTPPNSFFSTPMIPNTDGFFSTPMIPNTDTEDATTKKAFEVGKVGNTTNSNLTNIFNPKFWVGSWGKDLSDEEYSLRNDNYSKYSIFKSDGAKPLGGSIMANIIPYIFPFNLLINVPSVAGGCSSGQCPKYDDNVSFTVDLSGNRTSNRFYTPSTPLINTNNNANINAQSFLTAMRQNIQSPTITYTKKAMTPMEYGDFFNKNLAQLEREAQNKMATSLASGNCSPAIATNQCSGTKKSVNYATAVAQTSERRYYENYGTPMTRSDLVYS